MRDRSSYIRPPNEARSAMVRVVHGCTWSRCRFCGIYGALGVPAADRPVEDVLAEVESARDEWGGAARSVFLGDADPMRIAPEDFITDLRAVREAFPQAERLTCYGRLATAWARRKELRAFREAGLARVHAGLETGDEELLRFHRKGVSVDRAIAASRAVRDAGIELSLYVLLGLGGRDREREHTEGTVRVLNAARPEFVRFRRLWIHPACPLNDEVAAGRFGPQTPEGTVRESRDMVAGIDFPTELEALHYNVYCPFAGDLPRKREAILKRIDGFLALPEEEKEAVYAKPDVI